MVVSLVCWTVASASSEAMALLERCERSLADVRAISAEVRFEADYRPDSKRTSIRRLIRTGTLRLMRPNFARIDTSCVVIQQDGTRTTWPQWTTFASNGQISWSVRHGSREIDSRIAQENGADADLKLIEPLAAFFNNRNRLSAEIRLMSTWNDVVREFRVLPSKNGDKRIKLVVRRPGGFGLFTRIFRVGQRGWIDRIESWDSAGNRCLFELKSVRIDPAFRTSDFAFESPVGYRLSKG